MKKTDFNINIEEAECLFYNNLNERDKRLFAGLEAIKIGYYGVHDVSVKYKVNEHTVRKGKKELLSGNLVATGGVRRKGGGRKKK